MLNKKYRLRRRKDFRRTYKQGISAKNSSFIVYWRPNGLKTCRVGFSVSKKIGAAVQRNRVKRRLREACRLELTHFVEGYDYIFIARAYSKNMPMPELKQQMAWAGRLPLKRKEKMVPQKKPAKKQEVSL